MARRSAEPGCKNGKALPTRRSDRFLATLADSARVTFVSHVNLDPDSLGSMLGLAHLVDNCLDKPTRLTRDGLINAFNSLKTVDLMGLYPPANYGSSPSGRVPTRDSIIYQIDATAPAGVKPITQDFTGTAAMQSQF